MGLSPCSTRETSLKNRHMPHLNGTCVIAAVARRPSPLTALNIRESFSSLREHILLLPRTGWLWQCFRNDAADSTGRLLLKLGASARMPSQRKAAFALSTMCREQRLAVVSPEGTLTIFPLGGTHGSPRAISHPRSTDWHSAATELHRA